MPEVSSFTGASLAPSSPVAESRSARVLASLRDVELRYGDVVALHEASFRVTGGRLTGLVGRNGAGKSTSINLLAGLLQPDGGEVTLMGETAPYSPEVKGDVGFLLEDLALFGYLTPDETLRYLAEAYGLAAEEAERRTRDLLEFFGLSGASDRLVEDLSTGMRKRLAIAGALIHSPTLLVLDEPFESLDPLMVRSLKDLLRGYAASGGGVLLSSHLISAVEEICDEIVILERGRVVVEGETKRAIEESSTRLERGTLEELYVSVVDNDSHHQPAWLQPGGGP